MTAPVQKLVGLGLQELVLSQPPLPLVEVLKGSGQLQPRKDHDGFQVPLKLPQLFHSRGSTEQATLDLLVNVPGELLTYLGAMERTLGKR